MRLRTPSLNATQVWRSAIRSHAGCVRAVNEDRVLERKDLGLWAVADGMGGHDAGEIASAVVIDELVAGATAQRSVEQSLQRANRQLLDYALSNTTGPVGSTVVVLEIEHNRYICHWAGDSRAYLLRDGELTRLTHDHSAVQELVDNGFIETAEARFHPKAHIITRAVGVECSLIVDCSEGRTHASDTFLLCSDGLSNLVEDPELAENMRTKDPDAGAENLLQLALRRGAPDNVTVALVRAD